MKILSLFDGISCARVALERAGLPVEIYYASEIDKYAISISAKNYPNVIQVGSVVGLDTKQFSDIDLLIGGSPCQDLSIAKKDRKGLNGEKSGLFWEYVRILKEVNPKYFILENVASMPKEARQVITETLGVKPIMINASLVSAQNRKRLFWTNIPNVKQPEDRQIYLKDIIENGNTEKLKSYCIDANYYKGTSLKHYEEKGVRQIIRVGQIGKGGQGDRIYSTEGKSINLSANGGGRGAKTGLYEIKLPTDTKLGYIIAKENEDGINLSFLSSKTRRGRVIKGKTPTLQTSSNVGILQDSIIRKLTPIECERLQSLPDNYTEGVSNTQRYKALGNAFNVEVVAHILRNSTDY